MNDVGPAHGFWRLRDGEFDEPRGIIRVGGRTTELDRSCRAVLSLLLDNVGAPVSKERLLEAGWPQTIVHENSLAKAVGRLREALGEAGALLKAVYGIGYKLDAEILAPAPAAERPTADAAETPKHPARTRRLALALLGFSLPVALGLSAFAVWGLYFPGDAEKQFRKTPPVIGDAPDAVARVLWVDDHPENNIYEKQFFETHRIAVHPVSSSTDALKLLAMYEYDLVISDMGRGEDRLAGARLVEQMRANGDRTPAVIYTVRADTPIKQRAQRNLVAEAGAQGIAVTPGEIREIVMRIVDKPAARPPE
jgi:DNA-binding response OmpR family regulator